MRVIRIALFGACALIVGCPGTMPDNPAAVLEGDWTITPEDPGDAGDVMFTATWNSDGLLVQIVGVRDDGATVTLDTSDSTTVLDGSDVTITVPSLTGASVFEGTLSADQNTMVGSVAEEINLGDLEITLPGGNLTLERIIVDPCEGVTCDTGESCVDGVCVPDDPCEGVTCGTGESCVDGVCIPDDPCDGVTCGTGESCVDGVCIPDDPCEGVTCDTGETCVDGVCVPDDPCEGVTCDM